MEDISSKLARIKRELPEDCTLVAVSKTKPNEAILEAYQAGQRDFGENKVQDLVQKAETLPQDIQWHMIGHLQRNKVKYIVPFVHLIHGVDSLRLLAEINKQGEKIDRIIPCLLQVHLSKETTKFGFEIGEIDEIFQENIAGTLPFVKIKGLMGMASNTKDELLVQSEFASLKKLFDRWKGHTGDQADMCILSTGMSGDYLLAIKEGSTMVRVGSAIFGERSY